MIRPTNLIVALTGLLTVIVCASGCEKRVTITTGTTVGLSATPGDFSTTPPQVVLAYKRAELALVPTGSTAASKCGGAQGQNAGSGQADPRIGVECTDAYSTLAVFNLKTAWFGDTELDSFIATGHASRALMGEEGASFTNAFTRYYGEVAKQEPVAAQIIVCYAGVRVKDLPQVWEDADRLKLLREEGDLEELKSWYNEAVRADATIEEREENLQGANNLYISEIHMPSGTNPERTTLLIAHQELVCKLAAPVEAESGEQPATE